MKRFFVGSALIIIWFIPTSCNKKLDLFPKNDVTSEKVYENADGYRLALAKVYGSFANTGSGGAGSTDLPFGGDAGWSDFFRSFWKCQELTTDEAVVGWGDPGLQDFHNLNYIANNAFIQRIFSRSLFQIVMCNEFIRECADSRLSRRGISGEDAARIKIYKEEARFLRAFQYWVLLDLFRNPAFITEGDDVGKNAPRQIMAKELYKYIEDELLDLSNTLPAPRSQPYGHAERSAAWALLARLSLNAEEYAQENKYVQAMQFAKKVIDEGGYSLADNYENLFMADNDKPEFRREIIFSILYDGINTQTYGGTTFLVNAAASNTSRDFYGLSGNNGGWSGLRTTSALPTLFPDSGKSTSSDKRAMFVNGPEVNKVFKSRNISINDITVYDQGWLVYKFRNLTSDGKKGKNPNAEFCDTDMPLFRLAEMYLIYAEADLRNGGANIGTSLGYINELRKRAYKGTTQGQISAADLNLDFILDERARELYWEGHRRTDLIRYKKFTSGNYLWPWKGGSKTGNGVASTQEIFPLPATDIVANTKLKQNPGY